MQDPQVEAWEKWKKRVRVFLIIFPIFALLMVVNFLSFVFTGITFGHPINTIVAFFASVFLFILTLIARHQGIREHKHKEKQNSSG